MRRRSVLVALGLGVAAALAVPRESIRDAWSNLRRYSAPGSRTYALLAGALLGSFYDRAARDVVTIGASGTILEVGPGPGHLAERIARAAPDARVVGVDLDPAMVELARRRADAGGFSDRVSFLVGDVAALPLPDASVDLAVSTYSFHHWEERAAGLREIRRVLRPGGRAILFDLHPAWVRFETGGHDLVASAMDGPFDDATVEVVRWPFRLPLVVRADLTTPARAQGDEGSSGARMRADDPSEPGDGGQPGR